MWRVDAWWVARPLHARLGLAAVAVVVAALTAPGAAARATYLARTTADEPHYLLTAISLAEDGDLDVSDERAALRYLPFHAVPLPVQAAVRPDGTQVEPHDPLLPVLLAAPVGLGGWLAAKLTLACAAGILAATLAAVAVARFAVPPSIAVVTAAVAALSPPLAVYATQVYPELPAALAVTVAVGALTGAPRWRNVAVAGLAVAALPWLSVKYLAPAAALAAVALVGWWRAGARRRAGLLAAGLFVAGIAYLAAHQAWYGGWTPYAAGSHFATGEFTVVGETPDYAGRSVRLLGLLTDRDFGLLVWQPAWLAAAPALAALLRRRPPGTTALALPLAAGWLTATFVALTMQGWWWPGRQTVVVLPLVVLAVAWWLGRAAAGDLALDPRAARRLLIAVAVAGAVGVVTFGVLVGEGAAGRLTWVVDPFRTFAPGVRVLRPLLPDLRHGGAATTLRQLAWSAGLAVLAAGGWRSAARRPSDGPERSPAASRHRALAEKG